MRLPNDTLRYSLASVFARDNKERFLAACKGEWVSVPAMVRGSAIHAALARRFYPAYVDPQAPKIPVELATEADEIAAKVALPYEVRRIVSVETTWRYPLLAADYGRVWLQGTFDVLALDITDNSLWIVDWKSGKSRSSNNKTQMEWYIWLARRCGLDVCGALLYYLEQDDPVVRVELTPAAEEVVGQHIYGTLAAILAYEPSESKESDGKAVFPAVGVSFVPGYPENLSGVSVGDTIKLVSEPDNPVDPNAISIRHSSGHVGYMPKAIAARYDGPWEGEIVELLEGPDGGIAGLRFSVHSVRLR